uniref:RRM domain-containing protein n=1 Tax=Elaeophora elaphi TaxID=1147741 RepID=A0A0R3S3C7_9BILA
MQIFLIVDVRKVQLFHIGKIVFSVIGYTSRESAAKALEKMSGKEVDGQTVQVTPVEEKQSIMGGKNSEATKETERSPSEERSRSRTNSGSSVASGDEEKKNGSVDGNERSGIVTADSHKKAKNGEEHIGSAVTAKNTRNNRKRTSGANEDGEKNGDDSETSNDAVTPELKKKKSDTEEVVFTLLMIK